MDNKLIWYKHNHAWFTIWYAELRHASGFITWSAEIEKGMKSYRLRINGGYEGDFRLLNQAKQYARLDYEKRIK